MDTNRAIAAAKYPRRSGAMFGGQPISLSARSRLVLALLTTTARRNRTIQVVDVHGLIKAMMR
jgi:hypothetical protein